MGASSRVFLFAFCASACFSASAVATPAEEISRAVAVNGIADVSTAQPKVFLKAFTAVAMRAQPRLLPDYVSGAINLRPDLSPNIVAVAVKAAVKNWQEKPAALCLMIDRITRAAIVAEPDALVSIVKAGASASPQLRHCIISAAISTMPAAKDAIVNAATARALPLAFLTFSATENSGFSFHAATLNPANISEVGTTEVVSPEQPPAP